ncbi:MAG: sensor histidine kinase [Solirubrobacteraceae bacterium]
MLVTTVATLGVAALALLGPLEQKLRNAALTTLRSDVKGASGSFRKLDLKYVLDAGAAKNRKRGFADPNHLEGVHELGLLRGQQLTLGQRIGATVILVGYFEAHGQGGRPLAPPPDSDTIGSDPYDDAATAFRTQRSVYSLGSLPGGEVARAALPLSSGGVDYVLVVRRPITEVRGAVAVVRTAFITAALAGLALTLILGIPLAATLVRRLRRLRQAALRLTQEGPAADVPVDRARDEVGDLTRTFATMQRRLQQQEEARRAFVATASHELRTPLTSLDGMLELLDDDLRSGEPDLDDARSLVARARGQSHRLGRLAADLLDLSRIDADVELRSEAVELGELSRAVLAEFELGSAERGIRCALEHSSERVWALGDPGSVARILRILLDNALRASPRGEEIRVELQNGSEASLSVRDRGAGVADGERELIFERFQRGRDTGGQAGFGLGLAIGRELAQRMGGDLVLEDTQIPGATFTLRLLGRRAPDQDPSADAS